MNFAVLNEIFTDGPKVPVLIPPPSGKIKQS
jgi:hypothetical protein